VSAMPAPAHRMPHPLRRAGDALPRASIGTVPILWNNVDLVDLAPQVDPDTVLDEIARTGFEGTQEGRGFPRGAALRRALAERGLSLAEVYVSLRCSADGPLPGALESARERLRVLHDGGGDVLVAALDTSPERSRVAGRAANPDAPRLTDAGWRSLAGTVDRLAEETVAGGHSFAWHQHAATYVETPVELERLAASTDPKLVGICLDVGHFIVGGGDPVAALARYGERVTHLHLKDVDPGVLDGLRRGAIPDFAAAIRERLFTELGNGCLDLGGVLAALAARDFSGWLMVEQDSCWGPPSESAAIGRRVLAAELRRLGAGAGRASVQREEQ
jgi:inosose dehydratase